MATKADTFSVRLSPDVRTQVDELARVTRRSRSFIIQDAVESYVRDRAQYARELDEAILAAQTGPGHSGKQVFDWMDAWAAGDKRPLPEPDIAPKT